MVKLKILLIDDEVDFLELIRERLESWGYSVIPVTNGNEALEAVEAKKADVVLLDYKMVDMDGIAILKRIRKIDNALPVIMLTAYPEVKVMKEAEKLNISAFIPKVSAYSDIQTALKRAIHMVEKQLNKREV